MSTSSERLQNDAHNTRDDLKSMGKAAVDTVRERAGEVRDNLQQMGSTARDTAQKEWSHFRDTAGDRAKDLGHSLEEQVRQRPFPAVLVAAGIGFVFGLMWIRR
jgi:ElaB/YqjD/DUF883 family membrane-anchored ribosome-binding protein